MTVAFCNSFPVQAHFPFIKAQVAVTWFYSQGSINLYSIEMLSGVCFSQAPINPWKACQ